MLNKILTWYVNIRKDITVKRLKKENITDTKVIYFKNKDFQEEVLIDNNMNPHYTTTYFKAINIDANMFQPSNLETYRRKIEELNSEITELKTEDRIFDVSFNIRKVKK
jgi:hypothetical protein